MPVHSKRWFVIGQSQVRSPSLIVATFRCLRWVRDQGEHFRVSTERGDLPGHEFNAHRHAMMDGAEVALTRFTVLRVVYVRVLDPPNTVVLRVRRLRVGGDLYAEVSHEHVHLLFARLVRQVLVDQSLQLTLRDRRP